MNYCEKCGRPGRIREIEHKGDSLYLCKKCQQEFCRSRKVKRHSKPWYKDENFQD